MSPTPAELVARFGSPLYVYDGGRIRSACRRLRAALPDRCAIHFAAKANPSLAVLALLVREGTGLEIASRGELAAALAAGCPPDRILFAGPGKRDAELEAAVAAGVSGIHCESAGELRRLAAISARRGQRLRCGVRVHVPWSAGESRPILGGAEATKFGVPEAEARESIREWLSLEHLKIAGLHVFNASNVLDADALLAGARATVALACDLADAGLPLEWVDLGGGLGVPYAGHERPLDVERLGAGLAALLEEAERTRSHAFRLAIEPGRWLVAEAGEYVATVVDRKRCAGVEIAVLDGGVHHLLRPALVGQRHPARRAWPPSRTDDPRAEIRLVGPLCTALDTFGDHVLPDLRAGDLVAVGCAGAYGFTEGMPLFLSHPVPAEVLLLDGEPHLVRERREAESHLAGQHVPQALRAGVPPRGGGPESEPAVPRRDAPA
jgi:diaminopimelate decarboxylase